MDPGEQSHALLREKVGVMENQLNELREAMATLPQI